MHGRSHIMNDKHVVFITCWFRATKDFIHSALTAHLQRTGSVRASFVLDHFEDALKRFWVVIPASERENPLLLNVSEHPHPAVDQLIVISSDDFRCVC